jgi:hypothetical protein
MGAKAYGVLGTHVWTGALAGTLTGIVMTVISAPIYRLASSRALFWYSPLSVYVATALYGAVVFLIRWAMNDFHLNQIPWAVGVQSVLGMWWGITLLAPVALAAHLIAYLNHRVLRRILAAAR